ASTAARASAVARASAPSRNCNSPCDSASGTRRPSASRLSGWWSSARASASRAARPSPTWFWYSSATRSSTRAPPRPSPGRRAAGAGAQLAALEEERDLVPAVDDLAEPRGEQLVEAARVVGGGDERVGALPGGPVERGAVEDGAPRRLRLGGLAQLVEEGAGL